MSAIHQGTAGDESVSLGLPFRPLAPFRPARGLSSPHAQTAFAYLAYSCLPTPPLSRERWETPDGDFVDVDRVLAPPDVPHLVVLHGLEGSSRSGCVLAIMRAAFGRGWGGLALNFRSCSGEPNRKLRSYHGGDTQDLAFALQVLRERGVAGPLYAVGFSLGANVVLKLLAEQGDASLLSAGVAVSPPVDITACAHALDRSDFWSAFYRRFFLRLQRRKALQKAKMFPGVLDEGRIRRATTFRELDDLVTAPLHGFRDGEDYWARCSSGPLLGRIRRRTLTLSAKDDPIAPVSGLLEGLPNPHLAAIVTDHGGHVGFISGSILRPRFWSVEVTLQFLEEVAREGSARPDPGLGARLTA